MQTWNHRKLITELIKVQDKLSHASEHDGSYNARLRIETELMRRLEISDDERRKIYKNGYDQGRFDEDIERDHGMIRERKPLENGIEITCQIEYLGRLPKRERIE